MNSAVLNTYVVAKFDEIINIVAAMDSATANSAPAAPGANTPFQILTHCLGMMNEWVYGVIQAKDIKRDRNAEFEASGEVSDLIARAQRFRAELVVALAEIQAFGSAELKWPRAGKPPFWSHEPGGVLLHVFEELCQHLGHLELTRDTLQTN